VISEGSCDTEDCSNDSENTGINYILTCIKIENSYFKCILLFFNKINAVLVRRRVKL